MSGTCAMSRSLRSLLDVRPDPAHPVWELEHVFWALAWGWETVPLPRIREDAEAPEALSDALTDALTGAFSAAVHAIRLPELAADAPLGEPAPAAPPIAAPIASAAPAAAAPASVSGTNLGEAAALLLAMTGAEPEPELGTTVLTGDVELTPVQSFSAEDFTGAGQIIVVIDDGYSPFYDQSNTTDEFDYYGLRDDPDASVEKLDSHGSWVAQTALGVAPEADVVHFKVFPDDGGSAYLEDIEQALDAAIALAEGGSVAAVNLSLGFSNTTEEVTTILTDEFAVLDKLGVASVAAAGNDGRNVAEGVSVLAADPFVYAVSATTEAKRFAGFSQADPKLTDISALGVNVPVETLSGGAGEVDGTSFSAPYVSGAIALLQEASEAVLGGKLDPDAAVEILQLSGTPVVGAQEAPGYQVADADAALDFFLANSEDYADQLIG